ncbi:tRNA lysidine(34) synthetase TilS [Paucibacter soli]|uniref:tRNA lysidine(34) synthetase TilS n=1 Tax=Paucibacter soli TaxID=3133433 RepID=UPI0030B41AE6
MDVSATPRTADPARRVAVAYSGGRDSTALLHATAAQALGWGLHVCALHVHHGLSPQADAWLAHGQRQCGQWAAAGLPVSFHARRLSGAPAPGQSTEAWARAGRYQALAEMAQQQGCSLLLLAHHRRDQAETWLLQALRGAGSAGLAGMPREQLRAGLVWARPWLDHPRAAIEAYVAAHGLTHIEDDSNQDARYARNRIRLQLWHGLSEAFPQAEASLARAAAWAQQSLSLQQEIAAEDLARWADAAGLQQAALSTLSPARASNLLRAWLLQGLGRAAPASLVQRLLDELPTASSGYWPVPGGRLQLYRGRLSLLPTQVALVTPRPELLDLSQPGLYRSAQWPGEWQVCAVEQGGVAPSLLAHVQVRARQGGEQFLSHPKRVTRSLKKAWQAAGVPEAARHGPLLYAGAQLLHVPGLGLDARCWAETGQPQLSIVWHADASSV